MKVVHLGSLVPCAFSRLRSGEILGMVWLELRRAGRVLLRLCRTMQKLVMLPAPGERVLRFVGDRLAFSLTNGVDAPSGLPEGWRAMLRTNLGAGKLLRHDIIHAHTGKFGLADASWRDLPMERAGGEWRRELALCETGYYRAKAYAVDPQGRQHWPAGPDVGISIHPDSYRSANTIYCAFTRMFGKTRTASVARNPLLETQLGELDQEGYTVIPASGTLRDLIRQLPHIMDTLGCRVLHLLPVTPTPTTRAKFGRFGSPYALQDFTAIDPALVEFDKRTTGIDQFCELSYATHLKGGRLFLDVVANHTGWGAKLQEEHPEWYLRTQDGAFASPGAWGTTWEDLVETSESRTLGVFGGCFSGVVPSRGGWISLRCRLQNSRARLAIYYGTRAGRVSRNNLSARRARRFVGGHGKPADRGRDAMGLFGALSELFRARSGGLFGLQPAAKRAGRAVCSL